jgi:tubulin alpha
MGMEMFSDQTLSNISTDRMLAAFQVNTLGPLRVQQALQDKLKPGSKVCVISTGMSSIADNGSGGHTAYRVSKAAVNMLAKGMSCELKEKGISVICFNPGMVQTEFGPGATALKNGMGAKPVDKTCACIIKGCDKMTIEDSGQFWTVNKETYEPEIFTAGW